MSVPVLSAGVGSTPLVPSSIAVAELVILTTPAGTEVSTRTETRRVTPAPAARLPMFQVTTPAAKTPPSEAETNVVLAGRVSVRTTPVAPCVPALVIVRV